MEFGLGMVLVGLAAGWLSGIFGIGGGILVVPGLVYLAKMTPKTAQGTTLLMMLPPIGILAAWEYWRRGEADVKAAFWLCLGFIAGAYLGARIVSSLPNLWLKKGFGILLLTVGLRMLLGK